MARVLVTGGTGFIGRAAIRALIRRGDLVTVLSRNVSKARASLPREARVVAWNPAKLGPWVDELGVVDAVLHLAGEPVAQRWTESAKKQIDKSRGAATERLVEAIESVSSRPSVLVSASAIGIYGANPGNEAIDETADLGEDFLAGVCKRWEDAARRVEDLDVRSVQLRFGVVLGRDGGALEQMLLPQLFVGSPIGRVSPPGRWGKVAGIPVPSIEAENMVSWVHRDDVVGMALEAIDNRSWSGPVNCTAPHAITQRELADTIASVAGKFAFGLPEQVARVALGDMVDILVGEQNIYPQRAIDAGYAFHFAHLTPALDECIADA